MVTFGHAAVISAAKPDQQPRFQAMKDIIADRVAARIEGDFVIFLIGMRINKPWKVHKWWPVFMAMPRMLRELDAAGPETGFLGRSSLSTRLIVQYWRSFDHLEAYARTEGGQHRLAWARFNRAMNNARGDVGIWHETYLVADGRYEAVYSGMPPIGLGRAAALVPATGEMAEARKRLRGNIALR